MRRSQPTTAVMAALASILLSATPALAAYGAIAWDKESGNRGWSWNQATAQKAAELALSQCGASGCKVVIRTSAGRCAALATTADGKFAGGAARKTKDEARLAALANCQKGQSRRLRDTGQRLQQVSGFAATASVMASPPAAPAPRARPACRRASRTR